MKPIKVLFDKGHKDLFSFDLSAATDRLPIDVQVQVLAFLYGNQETAQLERSYLLIVIITLIVIILISDPITESTVMLLDNLWGPFLAGQC